jgi:hypothetical protein
MSRKIWTSLARKKRTKDPRSSIARSMMYCIILNLRMTMTRTIKTITRMSPIRMNLPTAMIRETRRRRRSQRRRKKGRIEWGVSKD